MLDSASAFSALAECRFGRLPMEHEQITVVGIDVSKGKSTVAARRPGGEIVLSPFDVEHTVSELDTLVKTLYKIGGISAFSSFFI